MKLISIDPGLDGTGVASFVDGELVHLKNCYGPTKKPWESRLEIISKKVMCHAAWFFPDAIAIELPFFGQTAKGEMVARKGDLVKLTLLAGHIVGQIRGQCAGMEYHFISVNQWKGQLKKPVVVKRIKRVLPNWQKFKPASHSWDAIGIGLFHLGVLE